jgi:hypothetical protein
LKEVLVSHTLTVFESEYCHEDGILSYDQSGTVLHQDHETFVKLVKESIFRPMIQDPPSKPVDRQNSLETSERLLQAFIRNVDDVERLVEESRITTIRGVELALIVACKVSFNV